MDDECAEQFFMDDIIESGLAEDGRERERADNRKELNKSLVF